MSLVTRHGLPALIHRGRDSDIALDVYAADSSRRTPTAGTLTLFAGSTKLLDAVAVTSFGPPATYTVLGTDTADLSLSSDWLAEWTLTIDGDEHVFTRPVYLVRRMLRPVITDQDLQGLHVELEGVDMQDKRESAWEAIQRRLISKGRRPQLIMDDFAVKDLHEAATLRRQFAGMAATLGDARYRELASDYAEREKTAWNELQFRYDEDEDGDLGDDRRRGSSGVLVTTRPMGGSRW